MTGKLNEHQAPWSAPHLVSVLGLCLQFELCSLRASTGPAPVQTLKKTGSRMPLRLKKGVIVCSNYILHMFNPCGDVTMSYLLWAGSQFLQQRKLLAKDKTTTVTDILLNKVTHPAANSV